jgi:small subunit ribosomal protein S1
LLGSKQGRRMHGGPELEHAFQHHLPVEGLVSGVTKGGVEVQVGGMRGFCPASQLDLHFIEDLEALVGQRLAFRIIRYEGGRHGNVVVSRRELLEEERRALAEQTRARLEEGAVLQGTVTSLKEYGAFVDIGGIEGMVHISELAFGRVQHPKDVLAVGQQVEVMVLRIEHSADPRHPQKIALSLRALAKDPWQDVAQQFPVGGRVSGTVTRLQPFGAFVELAPGIEGLVHISELGAGRRISHPHEVLETGARVDATVLGVDVEKHRISLSLDAQRQGKTAADAEPYAEYGKPKQSLGTLGDLLRETLKKGK